LLFNSLEFLIFLPTVFGLYWAISARHPRLRNLLLLLASYVFYGWWDWRFLGLIALSTLVDYCVGRALAVSATQARRKLLLLVSVVTNLGLLGFFKYWGFFVDTWLAAWASAGIELHPATLQIILPVGISFYTFQTLSYTIDVYRQKIKPTRDLIAFAAFVAFFPQLVAGPIERAANLLPHFDRARRFSASEAAEGLRQILWGLFKKIVVADQLAPHVDSIYSGYATMPATMLWLGTAMFAFQVYCDFSGYSDIAIGTARLFGINLMTNFRYPFFSRNIEEFWRRWHISLSTWFRDYVYIPLGGSRDGHMRTARIIVITFVASGFWHGANWTYITWGALHAMLILPFMVSRGHRRYLDDPAEGRALPSPGEFMAMLTTFSAFCLSLIFFRAENLSHALAYLGRALTAELYAGFDLKLLPACGLMVLLLCVEWPFRSKPFPLSAPDWPAAIKWTVYFVVFYWTLIASRRAVEFIYFQF